MKAVIVSGGKAPSKQLLEKELEDTDYIISADSGANCLYSYNITPDYLMGDFDSISREIYDYFKSKKCIVISFPAKKDFTDTELALRKAMELGADEIVLLGCTGSRIDHMLGNIGLLRICLEEGIRAAIKDDNNVLFLLSGPCELQGNRGEIFSVQAYCEVVEGLYITGAKYPLENYDLYLGDSLTISNEFSSHRVNINFKQGRLLVILSKD